MDRRGWLVVLVVALAVGLGLPLREQQRDAARYPVRAADVADARTRLDALPVRGAAPDAGYERERFGSGWADLDHDGCDTRQEILARDLRSAALDPDGCAVLSGSLADPYTGATLAFERGAGSADVQIDHVVALSDAWRTGAQQWDAGRRLAFANDPANLLAVDGGANQDKGGSDAAEWLPASGYACAYVVRQVRVKAAYGLWVVPDEARAMRRTLASCRTVP